MSNIYSQKITLYKDERPSFINIKNPLQKIELAFQSKNRGYIKLTAIHTTNGNFEVTINKDLYDFNKNLDIFDGNKILKSFFKNLSIIKNRYQENEDFIKTFDSTFTISGLKVLIQGLPRLLDEEKLVLEVKYNT